MLDNKKIEYIKENMWSAFNRYVAGTDYKFSKHPHVVANKRMWPTFNKAFSCYKIKRKKKFIMQKLREGMSMFELDQSIIRFKLETIMW